MKWYGVLKWLLFHLMLFQIAWYNLFLTFKLALCNLVRLFWKYSSEGYRPCVDLRRNFPKPKLPANCRLLAVFYKYDVIIGRFVYWRYASHCQIAGNLSRWIFYKKVSNKYFKQLLSKTWLSKIVDFAFFCDFVLFDLIFSRVFVGGGTSSKRVGGHESHSHKQ